MPRQTQLALLTLVFVVTLAGCRDGRQPAKVESLREHLTELTATAQSWRPDAYLADAHIPLQDGNPTEWAISAGFQSPTESGESLLVTVGKDGSIAMERVPHTIPVIQTEPFTDADWELDSAEALEAALDETGRQFLEDHIERQCSFMVLERSFELPGRPVVWWLRLRECLGGGDYDQLTVIDARTGEVLIRR